MKTREADDSEKGVRFLDARIAQPSDRAVGSALAGSVLAMVVWMMGLVAFGRPPSGVLFFAPGIVTGVVLVEAGVTFRTPKAFFVLALLILAVYQIISAFLE